MHKSLMAALALAATDIALAQTFECDTLNPPNPQDCRNLMGELDFRNRAEGTSTSTVTGVEVPRTWINSCDPYDGPANSNCIVYAKREGNCQIAWCWKPDLEQCTDTTFGDIATGLQIIQGQCGREQGRVNFVEGWLEMRSNPNMETDTKTSTSKRRSVGLEESNVPRTLPTLKHAAEKFQLDQHRKDIPSKRSPTISSAAIHNTRQEAEEDNSEFDPEKANWTTIMIRKAWPNPADRVLVHRNIPPGGVVTWGNSESHSRTWTIGTDATMGTSALVTFTRTISFSWAETDTVETNESMSINTVGACPGKSMNVYYEQLYNQYTGYITEDENGYQSDTITVWVPLKEESTGKGLGRFEIECIG